MFYLSLKNARNAEWAIAKRSNTLSKFNAKWTVF